MEIKFDTNSFQKNLKEFIFSFIHSSTFYLGFSTILLSYILPACLNISNFSNLNSFYGSIFTNLKNGNLFLTTTTIISTIIYDSWRKVQLKLEPVKDDPNYVKLGSVLNFFMLMSLITVVLFFAIVQPLHGKVSNIIIWIEIILFVITLMFHARVSWISDNIPLYQEHYLSNMHKHLSMYADSSRKSSLKPGEVVVTNKEGYDA